MTVMVVIIDMRTFCFAAGRRCWNVAQLRL